MVRWIPTSSLAVALIVAACIGCNSASQKVTLEDAAEYLDVSAVLPAGFDQVDPREQGLSNADLGLGPGFSEVVVYLSEEPFQLVYAYIFVNSSETDKATSRAELRDEEGLEKSILGGYFEGAETEQSETTVKWSDPAVGDAAKLAAVETAAFEGVGSQFEVLAFYQEDEQVLVGAFVWSLWTPGEQPTVGTLTMGREISARIASR